MSAAQRERGPGGLTREVETPLPSNHPPIPDRAVPHTLCYSAAGCVDTPACCACHLTALHLPCSYGAILAKADEASSFYNAYTVPTGFEGFEPEQNAATIGLAAVYAGGRLPTTRALKRGVTMHNVHALFAAHTNRRYKPVGGGARSS